MTYKKNEDIALVGDPEGTYKEVIDCLEWALNEAYGDGHIFLRKCFFTLRDKYGVNITTKFLRGLIQNKTTATRRIAYLLNKAGFKTKRTIRYYKTNEMTKWDTVKVEWKQTKKFKIVETPLCEPDGKQLGKWYKAEGLIKTETPLKTAKYHFNVPKQEVLFVLCPEEEA